MSICCAVGIAATNPPFAGDIGADETLSLYDLAYKPTKNGHRKRERGRSDALQLAPWEVLAAQLTGISLTSWDPERRVALEMAVTEECERADAARLATNASALLLPT